MIDHMFNYILIYTSMALAICSMGIIVFHWLSPNKKKESKFG